MGRPDSAREEQRTSPFSKLGDPRVALGIALAAVAVVYLPVIGAPFVWDDRLLIVDAPALHRLQPIASYFVHSFWRTTGEALGAGAYYRPLVTLSYALDYQLHGANPAGFHLTNLAFHLLDVALLFVLARRRGANGALAGIVAATWGLLPRLSEAVAWISGRTDVLATAFVLSALIVFKPTSHGRRVAAALLVLLGLLCKEVAVAALAPVLVLELDAARGAPRSAAYWLARGTPWVVVVVAYLALRAAALSGMRNGAVALSAGERALTVVEALGSYAWDVAAPWLPRLRQGLLRHPEGWRIGAGAAVIVALGLAAWRRPRGEPGTVAWLGLTALALAPVLHVMPLSVGVVAADRFLYLPLAGIALAVTPALARLRTRLPRAAPLAALALFASLVPAALDRVDLWGSEARLWIAATRHTPRDDTLPLLELSSVFYRNAQYADALLGYQRALATVREDPRALPRADVLPLVNTANALAQVGRYEEARALRADLAARDAGAPRSWLHLALSDLSLLDFQAADRDLSRALTLFPAYAQARDLHHRLPALSAETRRVDPLHVPATAPVAQLVAAADLCARLARRTDAEELYDRAVSRKDASPAELRSAVVFLVEWGSLPDAHRAFERWQRAGGSGPDVVSVAAALESRTQTADALADARGLLR